LKLFDSKKKKLVVASIAAVGIIGGGAVAANAATGGCRTLSYPLCANSVASEQVVNNSVTGLDVKSNSLGWTDLDAATQKLIKSGGGTAGPVGPVGPAGKPGVAVSVTKAFAPVVIEKIGGSYGANATEVATFSLPAAGTYLVNTRVVFDRKDKGSEGYVEPTTDTMPQLSLRYGTDGDAGTIMGTAISKAGFTELTGSSVATVTVDAATEITVRGFGYNEDRSSFGGGQISASGQVTAVKIG
jgi:uncharacterized protein (DUF697 family)